MHARSPSPSPPFSFSLLLSLRRDGINVNLGGLHPIYLALQVLHMPLESGLALHSAYSRPLTLIKSL